MGCALVAYCHLCLDMAVTCHTTNTFFVDFEFFFVRRSTEAVPHEATQYEAVPRGVPYQGSLAGALLGKLGGCLFRGWVPLGKHMQQQSLCVGPRCPP